MKHECDLLLLWSSHGREPTARFEPDHRPDHEPDHDHDRAQDNDLSLRERKCWSVPFKHVEAHPGGSQWVRGPSPAGCDLFCGLGEKIHDPLPACPPWRDPAAG